ncbi:hypothetical protein B0H63DRAFT_493395 [Podospora didyma]|uniref:DUF7896 domain-containing protein n=1 Tax=Podospora didyma TaxID=330526 RepID=A0AAE0NSB0_9PEZI|nr:hypothetical protein B0H63DRAFT_493395 [Podospora didyma]
MGQQSLSDIQVLEELVRQRELQANEAREQLRKARSSISGPLPSYDVEHSDYQVSSHSLLNGNGLSRSHTIPRSAALGPDIKQRQQLALSQDPSRPMKRSKTTHAPGSSSSSTEKMMRSSSSAAMGMTSSKSNPFVATGPGAVPPLYQNPAHQSGQSSSGNGNGIMLQKFLSEPASAYIHADSHDLSQISQQSMMPLNATGKEYQPAEFLSLIDNMAATSPIGIPTLLSPRDAMQFPGSSGVASACGSLTSGPSLVDSPMTRSNSNMNDHASMSAQMEMVRIRSQHSTNGHVRQDSFGLPQSISPHSPLRKRSAMDLDAPAMSGAAYSNHHLFLPSSAPIDSYLSQHMHDMERSISQSSMSSASSAAMERSMSKDSIKSNQSLLLKQRAKEALTRQIDNARARVIVPKPAGDVVKQEPSESSDIQEKDGKTVIPKAKYERPKHPKVKCKLCNENPEGFRGEHELRRHTEAKHKPTVKKWICRDPDLVGIQHSETAVKSLSECKQCVQGKLYGAYYNAAAHLRRTHFKLKAFRRSPGASKSSSGSNADDEKRGGKGGGDWPPMAELKLWMTEVSVPVGQEGAFEDESMEAADAEDHDSDLYGGQYGVSDTYNMSDFAGVGGSFNNDLDGVDASAFQSLQVDLSQHAELFINTSMYATPLLPIHDLPISSSSFDYPSQHSIAPSMMSIDGHSYTSPVSSSGATITQSGIFGDHQMLPQSLMHGPRDDVADMSFDLTFAGAGH